MATRGITLGIAIAVVTALLLPALLAGCGYETRFREVTQPLAMSINVTYGNGRSDVTVHYSVPPPKPGKVYVMWVYTKGRAQIAKLGEVPPGIERTAKGSASFPIQGVFISEESSASVTEPGKVGIIELRVEDQNLGPTAGQTGSGG